MKITRELIMNGRSPAGGWTKVQVALIGVSWPLRAGWIDRAVGDEVDDAHAARFLRAHPTSLFNPVVVERSLAAANVLIFTDGACWPNPGPGAWAAIVRRDGAEREMTGFDPRTTNNRMEMMAPIAALECLNGSQTVMVCTDSRYVAVGITSWLPKWKRKGWITADRKPVVNRDLWERLDAVVQRHRVSWQWVKGHDGHPENERADRLAAEALAARSGSV